MDNGLSFQDIYKLAQTLVQDNTTDLQGSTLDPLTFLKMQINIGVRILYNDIGGLNLEKNRTYTTSTSSNIHDLPSDCARIKTLYRVVGSQRYIAERIHDEDRWQNILSANYNTTSDYLRYVFARRSSFEIWPQPSTATADLYMIYEPIVKDLSQDDYTTGTISTLTNGQSTVTGSGTTFTSAMVGRFIKINNDGQWYEIESYSSATSITLVKAYDGATISGGSASYTIGEMPRLPGATHHIPAYFAAWQYFLGFRRNPEQALIYKGMYDEYLRWAKESFNLPYESTYIAPKTRYPLLRNQFMFESDI